MRPPAPSTRRSAVLRELAGHLVGLRPGERVAVAVDGFDGAGKTVLADQLGEVLAGERDVVRVSIDGFHRPRAQRIARGRGPETFYEDSYDYETFRRVAIEPFRRGEPVVPAVHDVVTDRPVHPEALDVGPDTVLLVDGIFLQRPELADVWDAVIWLDVPFEVSVPRGNARFGDGHDPDPDAESNHRYVGGQRRYVAEADPRARATWVLDNTDLDAPTLHPS